MATVTLSGFRELDRALSELPKATARNVLRRVGKAALQPMADAAAAKAPVDEGNLRISVVVSEKRTRRAGGGTKAGFVAGKGFRRDPKTSVDLAMGPGSGLGVLPYATFAEFGRQNQAADPFMRPAFDAGAQGVIDRIGESLGQEIDKAAKRLAKRAAKKAAS
jgi:HK97 gp10 family phage protein